MSVTLPDLYAAWCGPCGRMRNFTVTEGRCVAAERHADKVCPCGRPCASDRCDECKARDDL